MVRESVYWPVKQKLISAIEEGTLPPGASIPSEHALSREFDISRQSVRQALKELVDENLIFKRPGKGTFVRDQMRVHRAVEANGIRTIGTNVELPRDGENWYQSKMIAGIQAVCTERDCRLTLLPQDGLSGLTRGMVDAILVAGTREKQYALYERLASLDIYPALINRIAEEENVAYFSVNYRRESERAVTQLLRERHEKIGVVTVGHEDVTFGPRYAGVFDAFRKLGIAGEPSVCDVLEGQSNLYYAEAIEAYLRQADITAIYLLNGSFAMPLFAALQRMKRRIPEDLEILCFDDIGYMASYYGHSFRYIKMPLFEMARDATEYLLKKIEGGRQYPVTKRLYEADLVSVRCESLVTST